jgi:hypothetical protein
MSGDERRLKVFKPAMVAATMAYEARPYSGKALIVASSDRADRVLHPQRGFPALIPHLETDVVEGKHSDLFIGTADKLVRAMSSFLARHD